jgi:hypothetical protein
MRRLNLYLLPKITKKHNFKNLNKKINSTNTIGKSKFKKLKRKKRSGNPL